MSVEKIIGRILADADTKVSQIIKKAEAEAEAIVAQANKDATAEAEKIFAAGEKEAELAKRRIVASGEMEAKKMLLAAKQKLIDDAFVQAMSKLESMDNERFSQLLIKLIAATIETGTEVVVVNEKTKSRLPKDFIEQVCQKVPSKRVANLSITLAQDGGELADGFMLQRGDIQVNMTFDAILRQNRDILSGEIVKILF